MPIKSFKRAQTSKEMAQVLKMELKSIKESFLPSPSQGLGSNIHDVTKSHQEELAQGDKSDKDDQDIEGDSKEDIVAMLTSERTKVSKLDSKDESSPRAIICSRARQLHHQLKEGLMGQGAPSHGAFELMMLIVEQLGATTRVARHHDSCDPSKVCHDSCGYAPQLVNTTWLASVESRLVGAFPTTRAIHQGAEDIMPRLVGASPRLVEFL